MLIKQNTLRGIVDGYIDLAFRRWKRPTVKAAGTLQTAMGVLEVKSVDVITVDQITRRDASRAGYESRDDLLAELNRRKIGSIYRIRLRYLGEDPRVELRTQDNLSADELDSVSNRLSKMDSRSATGPWTRQTLTLIAMNPAKRAAELADSLQMDTPRFKQNVRNLKQLGLTESLKVGYRLSQRGKMILAKIKE